MKAAEDECSWSSPKGTVPWSAGTNVMDCSCQPLLGGFQPCSWPRTTFQFSWPSTKQPIQPSPCPRDVPDSGAGLPHGPSPVPAEALRWTAAGKTLPCHHLYAASSWDDFPDSIIFPDLRTQCTLVSSQIVPAYFPKKGSRQNKYSYFWEESECCYLLVVVMILRVCCVKQMDL